MNSNERIAQDMLRIAEDMVKDASLFTDTKNFQKAISNPNSQNVDNLMKSLSKRAPAPKPAPKSAPAPAPRKKTSSEDSLDWVCEELYGIAEDLMGRSDEEEGV